uniref:DUF1963 domain-containing protein n=1 Tax=Steinernema glaseri TaxID=37863 RepID=A0A1I8A005_9BILA
MTSLPSLNAWKTMSVTADFGGKFDDIIVPFRLGDDGAVESHFLHPSSGCLASLSPKSVGSDGRPRKDVETTSNVTDPDDVDEDAFVNMYPNYTGEDVFFFTKNSYFEDPSEYYDLYLYVS